MAYENTAYEIEGTHVAVAAFGTMIAIGIINGIINALSARQQADSFEERMRNWRHPELKFAEEMREFRLSKLEKAQQYIFTDLPSRIAELRQYEAALAAEKANPQALFMWFVEQIARAKDITESYADEQKANTLIAEFKEIHFTGCHVRAQPEATPQELLIDIQPTLAFMRRQFDEVQRNARGAVFGGDYTPASNARDQDLEAMEAEVIKEKLKLEALEDTLEARCNMHIAELETLKTSMPGIAQLYDLASTLIMPSDDIGDQRYRSLLARFKSVIAVLFDETKDEHSRVRGAAALMQTPERKGDGGE